MEARYYFSHFNRKFLLGFFRHFVLLNIRFNECNLNSLSYQIKQIKLRAINLNYPLPYKNKLYLKPLQFLKKSLN